jgi:hypothetical protein
VGISNYLDRVLETYSKGPFYEEVRRAREEFFNRTGRVAEGSEGFENAMRAFVDWYLFDRPLDQSQLSPVKLFVLENTSSIDPADQEIFENLAESTHSLFELLKASGEDVFVKDLVSGEKYVIEDPDVNQGFSKGDIFETRLLKFRDRLVFGQSFVFHPASTRAYILKQIKLVKYLDRVHKLKLFQKLSGMKLKTEQYPHIDVRHIYTDEPLF